MVHDLFDDYCKSLTNVILDALEGNDYELLRGIQCFSATTVWTNLQGMESLINTLFHKTIEMKKEAEEYRARLSANEVHYRTMGTYEVQEKRMKRHEQGKIPFQELKTSFNKMTRRKFYNNLNMLEKNGFIRADKNGWNNSLVWLPDRYWGGIIEEAINRGEEESIYSSSLGKMIAFASLNKPTGSLKAIIITLKKHGEKVTREKLKEAYLNEGIGERKMENFIKRDSQKRDDIRAIKYNDGRELHFNRELIRANERILDRARQLSLSRRS